MLSPIEQAMFLDLLRHIKNALWCNAWAILILASVVAFWR